MAQNMGLGFGLESNFCMKRKFRWLFKIPDVSDGSINALPPERGARPSLNFKEIEVQHLNEIIYFPGKPDWKPINLTLYDLKKSGNPIINWLNNQYNPQSGRWTVGFGQEQTDNFLSSRSFKKQEAYLEMYDGCGEILEKWIFENIWPNNIEWGELDMGDSNYVTIDLTLRYDRAYFVDA